MCLLKDLYVFYLILLVDLSGCVDVSGVVGVQLDLPDGLEGRRPKANLEELVLQFHHSADDVARRRVEPTTEETTNDKNSCIYQYPKKKQVDALLSNMMNELTKIFVRAREVLPVLEPDSSARARAGPKKGPGKAEREGAGAGRVKVKPRSRFRIVSTKNSAYFDRIYSNMTEEYRKYYHEAALGKKALRSTRDPCNNQEEIKELWQYLLDSSLISLKRAALRCVKLYLRTTGRSHDAKAKNQLGLFLLKEFHRLRSYQLDTLCDLFKMCYKELLDDEDIKIR